MSTPAFNSTSWLACQKKYAAFEPEGEGKMYCNATYDSFLCWPPTMAGNTARQHCPPVRLSDTTKYAVRKCNNMGYWESRYLNDSHSYGWTNYTPCYSTEIQQLFSKLYKGDSPTMKFEVAMRTRHLEILGFSISLAALTISLGIFCRFRSLNNNRTRIHKNLFFAMIIQVMIRLTLYIDQAILRNMVGEDTSNSTIRGIDNMPYLCESSYILLEYANTSMFMWMFIEGLYLHKMVTVDVFNENFCRGAYYATGWGFPVILTGIWAATTSKYFGGTTTCWWGYNLNITYWILEGPRLAVIITNMVFLLNIIRVLVLKLRQSHTSELEQVRKAVKAAIVLLPLLGITNLLNMTGAPLDKSFWEFALWSYTTHFLTSFQGFFIALLYCFLNGEVRDAVSKQFALYLAKRETRTRHKKFMFGFLWKKKPTFCKNTPKNRKQNTEKKPKWYNLRYFYKKAKQTDVEIVQSPITPETGV